MQTFLKNQRISHRQRHDTDRLAGFTMKRRKWVFLPLLGILMLLLCGCDRTNALTIYLDELPEHTKAAVLLCNADGQWTDPADLSTDIRTEYHYFSEEPVGWAVFEDTLDCDARIFLYDAGGTAESSDAVRKICAAYQSCKVILKNDAGEVQQTSDTIPLQLPDRFACAKCIIYNAAENTAQYSKLLPRTFCGLTVSMWTLMIFCTAMVCLPILLTLLLCGDMQRHGRGIRTAGILLSVPSILFSILYLTQRLLPYLNLNDVPVQPKDFCCLLAIMPFAVMLFLLWRRQRTTIKMNGVSDESSNIIQKEAGPLV
jgi:hypothetical protein